MQEYTRLKCAKGRDKTCKGEKKEGGKKEEKNRIEKEK